LDLTEVDMSAATNLVEAPDIASSEGKLDRPEKTKISAKYLLCGALAVVLLARSYWKELATNGG
jgi:hypothetical protein